MRHKWTNRSFLIALAVASLGISASPVSAQKAPSGGGGMGSTGGGVGSTTRGTLGTGSYPDNGNTGIGGIGTNPRSIFLSGKVIMDDGTQPNSDIRIERVCGGIPRLEAHTDSKGRFSFQVGQSLSVDTDASDPSAGVQPNRQWSSSPANGVNSNNRLDPLWNCELRASYPGYRSDLVELSSRRSLDDPDLGTIVLHRLANVQGSTISVTTALAPKHAQKDYDKGVQLAQKGDLLNAEKRLAAATVAYPKYAIAWFALGHVQQLQGKDVEAGKAFQAAIAADNRYVSPYDALAALAIKQSKWQDAADYSKQAIDLNPVEFPNAFWCNALANYRLQKPDAAEKSARSLLKLDTAHKYPEAENLLAHLLAEKGSYSEAAEHLRAYLALVPNTKDAATLRADLAKLEQASTQAKQ
ncbi:MAG TPA: tetratricopeptide repeat protein [Bryobacteraceae bacterium]|nr:tetratricopeptide repeat protein [Bryobacteraceae bacterium]